MLNVWEIVHYVEMERNFLAFARMRTNEIRDFVEAFQDIFHPTPLLANGSPVKLPLSFAASFNSEKLRRNNIIWKEDSTSW